MNGGHLALTVLSALLATGATVTTVTGCLAYIRSGRTPESGEGS